MPDKMKKANKGQESNLKAAAQAFKNAQQANERATAAGLFAIAREAELLDKRANAELLAAAECLAEADQEEKADRIRSATAAHLKAGHYLEAMRIFARAYAEVSGNEPPGEPQAKERRDKWAALSRAIRAEKGLTQVQMAERLGVTFATINRIERGHHEPTTSTANALLNMAKEAKIKTDLKAVYHGGKPYTRANDPKTGEGESEE